MPGKVMRFLLSRKSSVSAAGSQKGTLPTIFSMPRRSFALEIGGTLPLGVRMHWVTTWSPDFARWPRTVVHLSPLLHSLSAILVIAFSTNAAADELVVRISYRAPATCPSKGWFLRRVLQRVPSARLAADDEPARELQVVVDSSTQESHALLEFVD